jgi:predicted permease
VQAGVVSAGFFDLLGVEADLGRTFRAGDEAADAEAVMVLSHDFWLRTFGGDRAVLGSTVEMNDRVHTVVGVLPPLPAFAEDNDLYVPASTCPFRANTVANGGRDDRMFNLFARLAPGVERSAAAAEVTAVAERMALAHPEAYPQQAGFTVRLVSLRELLVGESRSTLLILLATVSLVLLIACANAANLTLARLLSRSREMAVRLALGAGRRRLLRQLVVESTLLALAGGAVGLLLAIPGLGLIKAYATRFAPHLEQVEISAPVLAFTLVVSLAAGVLVGLLAAWQVGRRDLGAVLKDGGDRATSGPGRLALRRLLVVGQLAVSVVLLAGAGLMVRTLMALNRVDPGFDSRGVLTARIDLDWNRYPEDADRRRFFTELLERLRAVPAVEAVALAGDLPLAGWRWIRSIRIEGREAPPRGLEPRLELRVASPGFLEALGVPLLAGRGFNRLDHYDAPRVALVNQAAARQYWSGESPLGDYLSVDGEDERWQVVGVIGDVRQHGLDDDPVAALYLPLAQNGLLGGRLVVRTAGDPMALAETVRQAVHQVDSRQPVAQLRSLEEMRRLSVGPPRFTTTLLALFAVLALAVTVAGIAGIVAFSVSERTHEIGVRMALGADRGRVLALVLGQGMTLVASGLALGVIGALAVTRVLSGLLYGVEPDDPTTLLSVALLLVLVGALTCLLPARRATAIDPLAALRDE